MACGGTVALVLPEVVKVCEVGLADFCCEVESLLSIVTFSTSFYSYYVLAAVFLSAISSFADFYFD